MGFYESWWTELEPTFAQDARIYLGHEADNPATLTSHDWITTDYPPWNHSHIRDALTGAGHIGYWNVHVAQEGDYEFRLSRWPLEADTPITAGLEPGRAGLPDHAGEGSGHREGYLGDRRPGNGKTRCSRSQGCSLQPDTDPRSLHADGPLDRRERPSLRGILRVSEETVNPIPPRSAQ